MALIKDGFTTGKLGDRVYYQLNGEQHFRDMPKNIHDARTEDQKLIREIFKGSIDERIICIVVNAKLTGQEPEEFIWKRNMSAELTASRMIAANCGWTEPMLLLLNTTRPQPFEKIRPEIVWIGFRGDKICLLAFIPAPGKNYMEEVQTVRLALRVRLSLYYHASNIHDKLIAVAEAPLYVEDVSLAALPKFYKPKAQEFLYKRYGKYRSEFRSKLLAGAQFAALELDGFPAPEHKFLRERISFRDLNGGTAHVWIDVAGMMEKKYGEHSFYCALKSRESDKVVIKLPERELDEFGERLAGHLSNLHRERTARWLGDPKKREAYNGYYREWYQERRQKSPEKILAKQRRATERRRIRYNTDPEYRAHRLWLARKWRKNNPEKYIQSYNAARKKWRQNRRKR